MIYFGRQELTLPHLEIGESEIEHVKLSKLLGLMTNNKLTWHDHVEYISSKASRRIYFLCILRRAGKPPTDIINVYTSVIRSVLEYTCEVWHSGLTKEQSDTLEHLQKRALRIAYLDFNYQEPCAANIHNLYQRREAKCLLVR